VKRAGKFEIRKSKSEGMQPCLLRTVGAWRRWGGVTQGYARSSLHSGLAWDGPLALRRKADFVYPGFEYFDQVEFSTE
jgi:hypothetical protein